MNPIKFTIDGIRIEATAGQTIMEAADAAGIYIPRLCAHPELKPYGSCRVCTVLVNGRPQSSCTQPASDGLVVENNSEQTQHIRRDIIEMLFVEGNHYCMFCEKSGNCELQAIAYRFGITAPKFALQFPAQNVDATHPDIFIDRNRCILCARCVRASRDIDGKNVFQFLGRGAKRHLGINSDANLKNSNIDVTDRAIGICPVGALLPKRVGFHTAVGQRLYDIEPIGTAIERRRSAEPA
ncbi:MAG: 2Fe-2S iron-sulfur cluster-binding protein [bacterium]|nr:2Fe-2S iron-sulfur cluster-binding protein [bacterium]